MATVRDVVREVVAEVAPHELPLVEGLRQLDDARVVLILGRRGRRDDQLGFGFAEVAGLATAVVWIVLDQVARQSAEAVADGLATRVREWLRGRLRRSRRPHRTLATPFDPAQLTRIRAQIIERATGQGIAKQQAEVLADVVVARLAIADSTTDGGKPDGTS